jgi:hypothetical protein
MSKHRVLSLTLAAVLVAAASSAYAVETCESVEDSAQEVLTGVHLTWGSSFLCADAPDENSYTFRVTVANDAGSTQAVMINDVDLRRVTPPRSGAKGTLTKPVQGLPAMIDPGESISFDLTGTYELGETDEGKKANLHYRAEGAGADSAEPFSLGINAHFRAPGVAAE